MRLPLIQFNIDIGYPDEKLCFEKWHHSKGHDVIYLGWNIFNIEIDIVKLNKYWLKCYINKFKPDRHDSFAMVRVSFLNLTFEMSYDTKEKNETV